MTDDGNTFVGLPFTTMDKIQYLRDAILKEVKGDDQLVDYLLYTALSNYTNNPINLLINSRSSGEGKTYPIRKVLSYFPKDDVVLIIGSSDKAVHHQRGERVIEDEETGKWKSIKPEFAEFDMEIETVKADYSVLQVLFPLQ
jgi:hypothetical protein